MPCPFGPGGYGAQNNPFTLQFQLLPARASASVARVRVTLVSNIFPPAVGGPATHVYHLALSLHTAGHKIRAVVCTDDPDGHVHTPFPLLRISWGVPIPLRYLRVLWQTWRAALRSDVVYINGIELPASLGALLAGRPRVLKIVGDWAWESALRRGLTDMGLEEFQHKPHGLRTGVFRAIQRLYCRMAQVVVVPSNYVAEIVQGWGVPASKIRVIRNALTHQPLREMSRTQAQAALGLKGPVICNVSRLYPWKRVDDLIRMTPEFDRNASFVIVGDGPDQPKLEQLASNIGVRDRLSFAGRVPLDLVSLYLRAADVFVLNTQYEGLSHTIIEAQHMKTPIVTTNVGGNREILRHGENALLVPYGDQTAFIAAVNRLLNNPDLAQRLTSAGHRDLDQFRWERLVGETLELLYDVTGLPRSTGPMGV